MKTRALTLEQRDQMSQIDQNTILPHQVSRVSQPLTLHAAETNTAFHKGKITQSKGGLVVVCTSELMLIDYCLLVSRH